MPKLSNEIKILMKSKEYLEKKAINEKYYFKLNGKYAKYKREKVTHLNVGDMSEFFKNDQISTTHTKMIDEDTSKTVTVTASFYDIWSFDPDMRTCEDITFDCDIANVPKDVFNLFDEFHHFDHLANKKEYKFDNVSTDAEIYDIQQKDDVLE